MSCEGYKYSKRADPCCLGVFCSHQYEDKAVQLAGDPSCTYWEGGPQTTPVVGLQRN